jgi:hypothetical protein
MAIRHIADRLPLDKGTRDPLNERADLSYSLRARYKCS